MTTPEQAAEKVRRAEQHAMEIADAVEKLLGEAERVFDERAHEAQEHADQVVRAAEEQASQVVRTAEERARATLAEAERRQEMLAREAQELQAEILASREELRALWEQVEKAEDQHAPESPPPAAVGAETADPLAPTDAPPAERERGEDALPLILPIDAADRRAYAPPQRRTGRGLSRGPWIPIVAIVLLLLAIPLAVLALRSAFGADAPALTPGATIPPPLRQTPSATVSPPSAPAAVPSPAASPAPGVNPSPAVTDGSPVATPTLPPFPAVPAGTVLYQADWSSGLSGWIGRRNWRVAEGLLVSDGSLEELSLIVAPFSPPTPDYSLEAEMRWAPITCCRGFGLVARQIEEDGYIGGVDWVSIGVGLLSRPGQPFFAHVSYDTDEDWHVYRMDVRGNRITLSVDGQVYVSTTDERHPTGPQVGLWAFETAVSVRSFRVLAN